MGSVHPITSDLNCLDDRSLIVSDPRMVEIVERVRFRLARCDLPVLIQGETGTGKDVIATALHQWSERSSEPFVSINCAAIPSELLEAELFGTAAGAYSGAVSDRPGLIEAAHGGVLFLDEIGDMSPSAQAKILRVIETRRVRRLGEVVERAVDFRTVAATHRDLRAAVSSGDFREDLFYRLKGAVLSLPPLRDRPREIRLFFRTFFQEARKAAGQTDLSLPPAFLVALIEYGWPGNVRELSAFAAYAAAMAEDRLNVALFDEWRDPEEAAAQEHPTVVMTMSPAQFQPIGEEIAELERRRMIQALECSGGNRTKAAELIHMPLRTFATKLKQYELGKVS